MENLGVQLDEKDRQQRVYEKAMASLKRQRVSDEVDGYALMAAWTSFGHGLSGGKPLAKLSKFSEYFLIGFVLLAPCLLFLRVAF